jgi:hypothetical protein
MPAMGSGKEKSHESEFCAPSGARTQRRLDQFCRIRRKIKLWLVVGQ